MSTGAPDQDEAVVSRYRKLAESYDRRTRWIRGFRWIAIARLGLRRGDVVLDVGCGTGVNFRFLEERVGDEGRIIGIDLSSDMLSEAEKKIASHEWTNVTLIEGPAEDVGHPRGSGRCSFHSRPRHIAVVSCGRECDAISKARWSDLKPRTEVGSMVGGSYQYPRSVGSSPVRGDLRRLPPAMVKPRNTHRGPGSAIGSSRWWLHRMGTEGPLGGSTGLS